MKGLSVICLAIVIGFVFSMNVYPDVFGSKCRVSFTQKKDLYCFKGSMFNYENTMVLYSWPLTENSTSLNQYVDYNGRLSTGHLSSESKLPNQLQSLEIPRLSSGKITGEIVLGIAGNIAFAIAGGYIAAKIGGEEVDLAEGEGILLLFIGISAGSVLGSALGVYLVGNSGNVKGSFGEALLGSAIGLGLSFVSGVLGSIGSMEVFLIAAVVLPPIYAAIYFNRSLRHKNPPKYGNALLNFRKGRMRIGIPLFSVQPFSDYRKMGKTALRFNMNVLSIQL